MSEITAKSANNGATMNWLLFPAALVVGLSLGLLGSGGSILTVPVLVYILGQDEKIAIASSLAIVGLISLFGSVPYVRDKIPDWRMVGLFGIPGICGTYVGAWASVLVSGEVQLMIFALVMLIAAWFMIRSALLVPVAEERPGTAFKPRPLWVVIEGLFVGALTGFVGVGGGFLIVPALVLMGGLTMHCAIATSLIIIAMKSAVGFVKYVELLSFSAIDPVIVGLFSLMGIAGCVLGGAIAPRLSQGRLKQGFGVVLLVMGVLILYRTSVSIVGV